MSPEVFEQGMAELSCHAVASSEETADRKAIRLRMWAEELAVLSDRQFRFAVREWVRSDGKGFWPTAGKLLEFGYQAPHEEAPEVRGYLPSGECSLCDGTGFEPFERSGYRWVRHCPRGCLPRRDNGPRPEPQAEEWQPGAGWTKRPKQRREAPYPNAASTIERLQAICREHYAVGDKSFHYPGIEADIAAEEAAAREAHEACYEK